MLFCWDVEIPPNTQKDNPSEQEIKLTDGIIRYVWVVFPPGCCGLVGCRMSIGEFRFLPANPDYWLVGSGESVGYEEWLDVREAGRYLRLTAYNEDDTYSHTLYIRVNLEPRMAVYTPEELSLALMYLEEE